MKLHGIHKLTFYHFLCFWSVCLKWCTRLVRWLWFENYSSDAEGKRQSTCHWYIAVSSLWLQMKFEAYCEDVKQNRLLKYLFAVVWQPFLEKANDIWDAVKNLTLYGDCAAFTACIHITRQRGIITSSYKYLTCRKFASPRKRNGQCLGLNKVPCSWDVLLLSLK